MPELRFEDHVYPVDDMDTVLNTLLKNGHAIPNFCRSGICHSCMMKAVEGTPLPFTQIGLSDTLVAENYFLTCQCAVYAPLKVARPEKQKRTRFVAIVKDISRLANNVSRLLLSPEHEFVYQAGQYTTLTSVDGHSGDFPIASVHGEGRFMEFHIHDDPDKPLNRHIAHELEIGDGLEIQTALGDEYYRDEHKDRDIVILGVDTLIAGGLGLLRKALESNHVGTLTLAHARVDVSRDYLANALAGLPDAGAGIYCEELDARTTVDSVDVLARRGSELAVHTPRADIYVAAPIEVSRNLLDHNDQWLSLFMEED